MKKNSKFELIRLGLKKHIEKAAEIEALIMTMAGKFMAVSDRFSNVPSKALFSQTQMIEMLRNEYNRIGNLVNILELFEGGKK